jgi:hypothetical protein
MAMKQRTRSLITLVALLALTTGAGLFAYYGVEKKQEQEKTEKEKKEKLFPDFDKAKIAQVTVTAKNETTVLARTKPDGWTIITPLTAAADKGVVDSLVDKVGSLTQKSVVEQGSKDLARYGLAKPAVKVALKTEEGKELVLRAGDENGFDSSIYATTGDSSDVVQVAGGFKWALEKSTFDLRDKKILPFADTDATALEVTLDDARFTLAKREGKWHVSAPIADRADEQVVSRMLGSLKNLAATSFVTDAAGPDAIAQYGLDKARLEVVVTLNGGVRLTLAATQKEVQGAKKSFARRHEGTFIAEIPEALFKDLDIKPADLRDKSLLSFDKDKVMRVTFHFDSATLTLERKKPETDGGRADDWAITAPAAGEAKKWKMNSVLWGLSSMKAASIVDDPKTDLEQYGLKEPLRTVSLFDGEGKELGTVAFGKEEADKVFARNVADSRIFRVDRARLNELPASRADLEELKYDAGRPPPTPPPAH